MGVGNSMAAHHFFYRRERQAAGRRDFGMFSCYLKRVTTFFNFEDLQLTSTTAALS